MTDATEKVLVVADRAVDEGELGRELDLEEDAQLEVVEAPTEPGADEAGVGEADPLLAVEDALASFGADRIVVVADAADDGAWPGPDLAEEIRDRTGLPVLELRS